jgi:hypothetical protein
MRKTEKTPNRFIVLVLLQWTWGILQTLLGLLFSLLTVPIWKRLHWHKCSLVLRTKGEYGISLGFFILMGESHGESVLKHEYGHCIQSMILGPLYLPVVGIPSFLRSLFWQVTKKPDRTYYLGFPEKWADGMGRKQ